MTNSQVSSDNCEPCAISSLFGSEKKSKGRHKPCITALVLVIIFILGVFIITIAAMYSKKRRTGRYTF